MPFLCFRPLTALFSAKYAAFCVAVAVSSAVDGGFAVFFGNFVASACSVCSAVSRGLFVFFFLLLLYMYFRQILVRFWCVLGLFVAIIYCFSILTRACVRVLLFAVFLVFVKKITQIVIVQIVIIIINKLC